MNESNMTIIEIGGVKLEVDLRHAKVIDTLRVGSRIKVLVKDYADNYKVYPGIIIGFDDFKNLPTVNIAYCKMEYSESTIVFASINAKNESGIQIVADTNEASLEVNKGEVLRKMDRAIDSLKMQIEDIEAKKAFFLNSFGTWFTHAVEGTEP